MLKEKNFIEIASVLVNPEIFTRPYTCDVEGYDCKSQCCYRACIVTDQEAKRIEAHFDEVLSYLEPDNRDVLKKNGTILADCSKQCPNGCEIHDDEARAIRRAFDDKSFRCTLIHRNMCSLLFTNEGGYRYCAVHAYALNKGIDWEHFKFSDCVQYPLSVYLNDEGKQVLSIQDTPHLDHIPCIRHPKGDPMYKSLKKTIEMYLGIDFYNALLSHVRKDSRSYNENIVNKPCFSESNCSQ